MGIEWHTDGFEKIIKAIIPETGPIIETVRIPSELDGKPVSRLGHNLFAGNAFIKTVIIPASVQIIAISAFYGCTNLKTIIFEDNSQLQVIDAFAFGNCDIRDFPFQALKNLQKIGDSSFTGNSHLGVVDLSNTKVASLSMSCFSNSGITEIHFSKNLLSFGRYCLSNTKLKKIDFSNIGERNSIGDEAFKDNVYLEEVIFPKSCSFSLGEKAFAGCSALKEISIPPNVVLSEYCFKRCSNLEKVVFEEGWPKVKFLPEGVFKYCPKLKTVQIDTYFTEIGFQSFFGCESLEKITFPDTLQIIRDNAFGNCSSIKELNFSNINIQEIKSESFAMTNFDINGFKMDFTSGTEFETDVFEGNDNISLKDIRDKYPFCNIVK